MSKRHEPIKVRNVMHVSDELAHPDHTVHEVAVRMRDRGIPFLPVVDGDEIVGVVEAQEIIGRVSPGDAGTPAKPVREVMSSDVLFCFENDDIETACAMAKRENHRHLIVVDDCKNLVGSVSAQDLERCHAEHALHQRRLEKSAMRRRHLATSGRAKPKATHTRSSYSVRPKIKE